MKSTSISFWKKETGNMMTHSGGLTQEQVEFLQGLKKGDRLLMFINQTKETDTQRDGSLVKYEGTKRVEETVG